MWNNRYNNRHGNKCKSKFKYSISKKENIRVYEIIKLGSGI